ncbi:MAG: transposase [Clostridiales bacterium]|nr:transposase [Clostridiales bacterium]
MYKAFVFRIYPNREQATLFAKTFGCVRFIYNKMLGDMIAHYETHKTKLKTWPAKYKEKFPWLKEVDGSALGYAYLNLLTAFNNFFAGRCNYPKFKSKHKDRDSYTTYLRNGNIKLNGDTITLPKTGAVKIVMHREIPAGYKPKSCTVSRSREGKYYVSILFEYDEVIVDKKVNTAIGLDFAMKSLYVDNEGNSADYPRFYRMSEKQLAKAQRRLSKCKIGGKNYRKQRIKVAKRHAKTANQRKDFLHKESRRITNAYDVVFIEDLDMQRMGRGLRLGKSVHDVGWGMFTRFLGYKLAAQGKKLVKVGQLFPSSKMCSKCGNVKDKLLLSERTYTCCECGNVMDRDENAAINIKREGLRILDQ